MKMLKRMFCAALVFLLLVSLLALPAGAIAPGSTRTEDLTRLYEMKCGHALDRVIAVMCSEDIAAYPFFGDAQVERIELRAKYMITFAEPYHITPDTPICEATVYLNTRDDASLDAFIARYETAQGVAELRKDEPFDLEAITYGICVTLRTVDAYDGTLLPVLDYTPETFGEAYVKSTYTRPYGQMPLSNEGKLMQEMLKGSAYEEAEKRGVPGSVILELKRPVPAEAAAFALELIDFEHSELFTEAQKAVFRAHISDISLFPYETETPEPLLRTHTFRVWTNGSTNLTTLSEISEAERIATDGKSAIWYVTPTDDSKETLFAVAAQLNAIKGVSDFRCLNGIALNHLREQDTFSGALMDACILLPGDANKDGKVNTGDARAALRHAVGIEPLSDAGYTAADTDGDGKIDTEDARTLLRAAVGLISPGDLRFTTRVNQFHLTLGPLRSYHDGGFLWSVTVTEGDAEMLRLIEYNPELWPPVPGSGPYTLYSVLAYKTGDYTLHIECKQPWSDGEDSVAEAYDIRITVRA